MEGVRNLVAVNENLICYSVKRNLIRVIHTTTTEKSLLRGHSGPIADLCFSIAPHSASKSTAFLCSGDASTDSSDHMFVWQLDTSTGGALNSIIVAQFSIQASVIAAHPLSAHVWGVAVNSVGGGPGYVGVVSRYCDPVNTKSYRDLPMYAIVGSSTDVITSKAIR